MIGFAKFIITEAWYGRRYIKNKLQGFAKSIVFLCRALKQNGVLGIEVKIANDILQHWLTNQDTYDIINYRQAVRVHLLRRSEKMEKLPTNDNFYLHFK